METRLLKVHGSAVALPAEVGVKAVQTGKGYIANLEAERDLSVFNHLNGFSVTVAFEVLVSPA